jgi:hypothetical protein
LSNPTRDDAPYDHPRFARTSCMRRDVNVPPNAVFATKSGT